MRFYNLMRKNIEIADIGINNTGEIEYVGQIRNNELIPFNNSNKNNEEYIKEWWSNRKILNRQSGVKNMLLKNNIEMPADYLVKNLGLSLNDYYWIRPANSIIKWEDVNFFDNNFTKVYLQPDNYTPPENVIEDYVPNATLKGQLEKTWLISGNSRLLLKGNSRHLSAECQNEVFASLLHKQQGNFDFVEYSLTKVKDSKYDWGCLCKCFTDQYYELITADAILKKEPRHGLETCEYYIQQCVKNGLDEDYIRKVLEYQILTDFIMTNQDRHAGNFGVLRNADTLKFEKVAPIYDNGRSFFAEEAIISDKTALKNIEPNSAFASSELELLSFVTNRNLVDISKLPSVDELRDLYCKDTQNEEQKIEKICETYKNKIELFEEFQRGKLVAEIDRPNKKCLVNKKDYYLTTVKDRIDNAGEKQKSNDNNVEKKAIEEIDIGDSL